MTCQHLCRSSGFPGLQPGDRWCLCAPRWQEAVEANRAPRVVLRATGLGLRVHSVPLSLPVKLYAFLVSAFALRQL